MGGFLMDELGTPINTAPWSKFLAGLEAAGAVVSFTKTNRAYLRRNVHGRILTVTLPSTFDPSQPDKSRGPGCLVFDSICRNLDLNPLVHFKGWYAVL